MKSRFQAPSGGDMVDISTQPDGRCLITFRDETGTGSTPIRCTARNARKLGQALIRAADELDATAPGPPQCLHCGTCCRRQPTPPFMRSDDAYKALPAVLREQIESYIDGPDFDDEAPCLWLMAGGCRHYDLRPQICRDYACGEMREHPAEAGTEVPAERPTPSDDDQEGLNDG